MQTWNVDSSPPAVHVAADAVGLLMQDGQTGQGMLAFLNRLTPVDYLSVVEYVPDRCERLYVPQLAEGRARPGVANVTPECFARYRRFFWQQDEGTRVAHQVRQSSAAGVAAMHVQADEIKLAAWRQDIYERAQLAARLSFFYKPVAGRTYSVNLYRDRSHGDFTSSELEVLLGVALLLKQAHRMALLIRAPAPAGGGQAEQLIRSEAALRHALPELSPREAAVCARIACGMGADGIAVDLGVAHSTVVTLRKRAYAKLAVRGVVGGRMRLANFLHSLPVPPEGDACRAA